MPPIAGLRVVNSGIHGYGVVAERDFAPGEVVADVDGYPWNAELEDRDDRYSLWLDDEWCFDMLDQTRWINHSCAPNCEIEGDIAAGGRPAWARLVALRPIRAGEELTYDYGFTAELAEPCMCGAASCRGWIVDEDELPRLREMKAS
jgi:hypothetical protein